MTTAPASRAATSTRSTGSVQPCDARVKRPQCTGNITSPRWGVRATGDQAAGLPEATWDWFCVDDVRYHGRSLTIVWDRDGKHYRRGAGLAVFADGKEIARAAKLERVTGSLR